MPVFLQEKKGRAQAGSRRGLRSYFRLYPFCCPHPETAAHPNYSPLRKAPAAPSPLLHPPLFLPRVRLTPVQSLNRGAPGPAPPACPRPTQTRTWQLCTPRSRPAWPHRPFPSQTRGYLAKAKERVPVVVGLPFPPVPFFSLSRYASFNPLDKLPFPSLIH